MSSFFTIKYAPDERIRISGCRDNRTGAGFHQIGRHHADNLTRESDRDRATTYSVVRSFINKPLTIAYVSEVAELLERLNA